MKMLALALCLLSQLSQTSFADVSASVSTMSFGTSDHETISAALYPSGRANGELVILAAGFAQFKNSTSMVSLCKEISRHVDTLCMDFRGTGGSSGTYEFGAVEHLDLEPLLNWGRQNYKRTTILGFSLGAYSAVRAAALWPDKVDHLLLVSCPTKIDDIVWHGDFLSSTFNFLLHPSSPEGQTGANFFFRWGWLFTKKPSARSVIKTLQIPVDFLVGGNDYLVPMSMSKKVYDAVRSQRSWTELTLGDHAEAMYLQYPDLFMRWILESGQLPQ